MVLYIKSHFIYYFYYKLNYKILLTKKISYILTSEPKKESYFTWLIWDHETFCCFQKVTWSQMSDVRLTSLLGKQKAHQKAHHFFLPSSPPPLSRARTHR